MSKLLVGVEAQPRFPQEDLSDDNAALLELMLANREIAQMGHVGGEQFVPAFQYIHPAALQGAKRVYEGVARIEAVDHGVATFETMCVMTASLTPINGAEAARNSMLFAAAFDDAQIGLYMADSLDTFREQLPRASEVIKLASYRFFGSLTEYALLGAAITRRIELASRDTSVE